MKVAITGYIGAGKTTTCHILNQLGYSIIEADLVGHELLEQEDIAEQIRAEFGIKVLDRGLKVDREKLSSLVFANDEMLAKLNLIVHPALKERLGVMLQEASGKVAVDAALYLELGLERMTDKSILVSTDIEIVYDRLNPMYTKQEILNVMNSQKLISKPDFTIDNNGSLEQLKSRIDQILKLLSS